MKYDGVDSIIKSMDFDKPKAKFNEFQSRKKLLNIAKNMGCDQDLIQIFNRYDKLLSNCKNPIERKHISILGISEVNKLFGYGAFSAGGLDVDA